MMQRSYKYVIVDTSCFILLNKIDELVVLKELFSTIIVTPEIALEFKHPLPEWVNIKPVRNSRFKEDLFLELELHPVFHKIRATNFHISPSLLNDILKEAGE